MAETTTQCVTQAKGSRTPGRGATINIPCSSGPASRLRNAIGLPTPSPVTQNGSFEFDRVIKSGYVHKRTRRTKAWKQVFLVLRPNSLFIYKSDNESKLRHKLHLPDLSAATPLKDPKQRRHNLFGLFSPDRNYHFEAPSTKDAQEWISLIRQDARIEEEEEEMFLASPIVRRQSYAPAALLNEGAERPKDMPITTDRGRAVASSPEPCDRPVSKSAASASRRLSHHDYSGMSGNELASQSDFSDTEPQRAHGASLESFTIPSTSASATQLGSSSKNRPMLENRNNSQLSGLNIERDPDRVVWQGWLWYLKGKRGVRQWKNCWAVLRPRNLILYKDESEYTASFILSLSTVVNVVDIDPVSRTKQHCLQVISDEKGYRFCAHDEETLVHCLGAFKSLLSKRKDLQARAAASGNVATQQ
ncbi:Uu.00g082340.m01.CDS01 [Anthostomella pinea]|uniref:Uu.00g082340.m01.CDS01 n=1 Tax=Anthostomella pinea TaxID=933095 RepID=A0AAI8VLF8_9PEZI|nr:Uu.00g082340.m01.CDS01 [Anthostomella pinea]